MRKTIHSVFVFLLLVANLQFSSADVSSEITWQSHAVGGGNLQKMNVINEDTAYVAGYDNTFLRSINGGISWEKVDLISATPNFLGQSYVGSTGYVIGGMSRVVDYDSKSGYSDVNTAGVLLKYADGEFTVLDNAAFGEGDDPATNPNARGNTLIEFMAVEAVTETTAYIAVRWSNYNNNDLVRQTAIFKTTDGGDSWSFVLNCNEAHVFAMAFDGETGYITGNGIFFKTEDGGANFTDLYPSLVSLADDNISVTNIHLVSATEAYIVSISDGVFYTNDGGVNLSKVGDITGGNDFLSLEDSILIAGGSANRAKISTDAGATFSAFYPGFTSYRVVGPWNDSVYFLGKGSMAVMAMDDIRNQNTDGFNIRTLTDGTNLYGLHFFDDTHAIINAFNKEVLETTDGGKTWHTMALPELPVNNAEFDFIGLSTSPEGTGYLSARWLKYVDFAATSETDKYHAGVIFKTKNNWKNWEVFNIQNIGSQYTSVDQNPSLEGCYMFEAYASKAISENTALLYASWKDSVSVQGTETKHSRVFRTEDDGETWEFVTDDLAGSFVVGIAVHQNLAYVFGNNELLKSTDGGKTFVNEFDAFAANTDGSVFINEISFRSPDHFFVTTSIDGIYETKDGGASYTALTDVSGGFDILPLTDSVLFIGGTTSRTQFTQDGGKTWLDASAGTSLWKLGSVWNKTIFGLAKGEIFSASLAAFGVDHYEYPTEVEQLFAENANPLKVVQLGAQLNVQLQNIEMEQCYLFNAQGMQVATTNPKAGNTTFNSSTLPSGVYIVMAVSGAQRYTQKIVIR